ncbi:MAG: biotin synthase BioB [Succinivibrio sp.]|nr:biotin synthase BioB [Succinivibrio sp.]
MNLTEINEKVLNGIRLSRDEGLFLLGIPLSELRDSATKITKYFFHDKVELCCISAGKCGKCSEDCKFCAQSSHYETKIEISKLKTAEEFFAEAKYNSDRGVHRFSIVTSGVRLSKHEVREVAKAYKLISENLPIKCCGSLGLLDYEDFLLLAQNGLSRIHDNLETSRRYFPQICTTHTFDDKVRSLLFAKKAGLSLCSGCIIGMGEEEYDRIDLALSLAEIGVDSVPINILNPIKGTPLENRPHLSEEEIKRCIAIFRHILPKAVLRLAGGRTLIRKFYSELYDFGINAEITGDMLTTSGFSIENDVSNIIAAKRIVGIIDEQH